MQVLDKGHLILAAVYGSETDIVSAARVCTSTECSDITRNEKLLEYLIRNGHTSPLEMMQFLFRVKAPIFVARQWMRHRTWSYNEASQRYKESPCEFYIPECELPIKKALLNTYGFAHDTYFGLLDNGMTKEQARIVLPLATYTEFVCQVDLNNLLKFLEQRLHPRAQWEIRQYAIAIAEQVQLHAPTVWRCFVDLHPEVKAG